MQKNALRRTRLILAAAMLSAAGCATKATITSNVRRSLPVIVDESAGGGRRLEAGFAWRSGQDKGERTASFYDEAVNQTFEAYGRSNTLGYLRFTPRQIVTLRLGVDDIGYCGDVAVRTRPAPVSGYFSPGLTVADRTTVSGYTSDRPLYWRATAGGSVAPFALDNDSATGFAAKFRIYGNLSWTEYPVWIDFAQTYYDSSYAVAGSWSLKRMERGEAKIAGVGVAYQGDRLTLSIGLQYPFGMSEQAVRVDLASQPPYLAQTNPVPPASLVFRAGVRF
jgi:hypothetical protein